MPAGSQELLKHLGGKPYRDRDSSSQINHPPNARNLEMKTTELVVLRGKPQKTVPPYLLPGVIAVSHIGIEYHPYTWWWVLGARNELSAVRE